MATYRFEAAHQSGSVEKGEVDADSARAARSQLRARGLVPISVQAHSGEHAGGGAGSRFRLSEADLALVTRQLASLLTAQGGPHLNTITQASEMTNSVKMV